MNDQQEPAPDQPDTQPPADETPAKAAIGLGESTPVRALSSVVAFAATCLIVATVAGAAAILVKIIPATSGGIVQRAAEMGFHTLMRCWLAGLVAVVMTNSFLRGNRRVVVRRSGILGAVSGLLAVVVLAICLTLLEGRQIAPKIVSAMPYLIAAVAGLICLSWRAGEDRSAADEDADEDDDKNDEPDGSES